MCQERELLSEFVFQVGMILAVEAGFFPLMCGWWIDICAFVSMKAPPSSPPPPSSTHSLQDTSISVVLHLCLHVLQVLGCFPNSAECVWLHLKEQTSKLRECSW